MAVDDTPYGDYRYLAASTQHVARKYRSDHVRHRLKKIGIDIIDVREVESEPEIIDVQLLGNPYTKQYFGETRSYEQIFTLELPGKTAESLAECVERVTEFERRAHHYESELRVSTASLTKLQVQMGAINAFLKDNPSAKDKWDELVVLAKLSGVDLKLD